MKVKEISGELSAKIPMQDYGFFDVKFALTAEYVDGDGVAETTQELTAMLHHGLEQMLIPAISNKLEYAARVVSNWPEAQQRVYWSGFLAEESVKPIVLSGVIKADTFDQLIASTMETAQSELQSKDKQP